MNFKQMDESSSAGVNAAMQIIWGWESGWSTPVYLFLSHKTGS